MNESMIALDLKLFIKTEIKCLIHKQLEESGI